MGTSMGVVECTTRVGMPSVHIAHHPSLQLLTTALTHPHAHCARTHAQAPTPTPHVDNNVHETR
eukprot:m.248074 g.248074  ORF g.248074 m.248074 type:complete len:64 (+) comp62512_c0_seq1:125-316(+)